MNINVVAVTASATAAPAANRASMSAIDESSVPTVTTTVVAAVAAAATEASNSTNVTASSKTLKRCLSVPIIRTLPLTCDGKSSPTTTRMTTRSAAAAGRMIDTRSCASMSAAAKAAMVTPKKHQSPLPDSSTGTGAVNFNSNITINVPRSNPCSREVSPAPMFNIFAPRARRYSASSYCPLGAAVASVSSGNSANAPLCLTPRVSQLRQEECVDMNSREVNHEREVHSAMQMSQSWEDLTLVAENWSCKSDEFSNPLQVALPSGVTSCSSPSPTSNRPGLRLPYGLSPSPTRRTFATRRSMSPIAMRPSQLGPVKRKFELEDNSSSNWNVYSPPPLKKIFTTESRGSSPVYQSPSSVCPSPDSGTYDGRMTPKLLISKLCTTNTSHNGNSNCSSPMSASSNSSVLGAGSGGGAVDSTATSALCTFSSSSSSASSVSGGSEPMCIGSNIDEGISISEVYEKQQQCSTTNIGPRSFNVPQPMATDMQDEATLMDDIKSETSSIGGCSSISIESSSCDSGAKAAASFLNKLNVDDMGVSSSSSSAVSTPLGQKNFFINKQGLSGQKKYVVNHEHLPSGSGSNNSSSSSSNNNNSSSHRNSEPFLDSINVSSTTGSMGSSRNSAGCGTAGNGGGGGGVGIGIGVDDAAAAGVIVKNNS